jgi:hypothetical protein
MSVNVIYRFHERDPNRDRRGIFWEDIQGRFGRGGGFGVGGVGRNLKGSQLGVQLCKPKWDLSSLTPFLKNFYIPHPDVLHRYDTTFVDTLCI